jgi:3-phenylpropionate/cinnamic acid dioxygenase small subunit
MNARLERLADQHEIRDVIYSYCRGIDRRDFALVRDCFHADATDDHGDQCRSVDEFIDYVQVAVSRYERTMHFIGNVLVAVDGDTARAESYAIAYHRLGANERKPERDYVVGLRYVDDFERRDGQWRIATRVCVFEWSRVDVVASTAWALSPRAAVGHADRSDLIYRPTLRVE